jgi:hypothetical protein
MSTSHAESVEGSDLREWMFPEEDRAMYTTAPWTGGFRWFRARNVVYLEQWRKKQENRATPAPPPPGAAA